MLNLKAHEIASQDLSRFSGIVSRNLRSRQSRTRQMPRLKLARLGPSEMSAISSLGDGKRTLRKPEEAGLNKLDL
jgi:cystathionine beta-lyase/cystathionine gamma-synthase